MDGVMRTLNVVGDYSIISAVHVEWSPTGNKTVAQFKLALSIRNHYIEDAI
jgi:hypothetical protein